MAFREVSLSSLSFDALATVRRATLSLTDGLSDEDMVVQSMPDASPIKWHLAHTTWFFESLILIPHAVGYLAFDPAFAHLFNSYYESLGPRHPRPKRGLLTRPSLDEVMRYRSHVEVALRRHWDALPQDLLRLGLNHEQQHQELMLTDLKHLFSCNPLRPAFREAPADSGAALSPLAWRPFEGGVASIGHSGEGFAFDNEGPRHQVYLNAFQLADRCVTETEYLAFMGAGGYREPALWLSEGWEQVRAQAWESPEYWFREDGQWRIYTLQGVQAPSSARPVCHLSYFEADAYARWAGKRLPTEAEWEVAVASASTDGRRGAEVHPTPIPEGAGLRQVFGGVWEWTTSAYGPYPGYRPANGAIGEYNGKFMVNQMVLRGGSCATPPGHSRPTYRNFFPAGARWQFSGLRLAQDA